MYKYSVQEEVCGVDVGQEMLEGWCCCVVVVATQMVLVVV